MFQRILAWIREVINKMIQRTDVKSALKIDVAISAPMAEKLQLWSQMYANESPWLNKDIKSLNLAAAIAGEIARAVTIEMAVEITGSPRADYLSTQYEAVLPKLRAQVEYGAAKGGLVFKPFVNGKNIDVDYVQADCFYPVAFDSNGNIISCIFSDQRTIGESIYTRLELHQMTEAGYVIKNQAFRSQTKNALGAPVGLDSVPEWKDLQPEAKITGIDKPLFSYFRYPLSNNIDSTSPLGVSCYSRATELIEQADKQWSDLLWEFESGQRALYADVVAFTKDVDGKPILPMKRLYKALGSGSNIGEEGLFQEWTPDLREVNILNGLDSILKRIEFNCGLAYGVLSNPQTVDKTATEIKISNQRSYSTIKDTQKALQKASDQLLYAMDVYATLYKLSPKGAYSAVYDFDDSVIVDKDAQFQQDLRLVTSGLMSKIEFRMRNFGEDEKTATEKIAAANADQPKDFFNEPAK